MLYIRALLAGFILMTPLATAHALEIVDTPKVLPDRAVDTSSLKTIVQGVCKPGMTEQQRFLALYQFYRRMVYHHRYMGSDRRSILRVINSYGCLLCGSQAASFSVLLRAAGFKTRVAHVVAEGYGGHTAAEVFYDDAWHGFDTMTAFYVRNRKGTIASFAELKADPTLIRDAVKEKRVPPEWCLCTREFEPEQKGIRKLMHRDAPWSLLRWGEGRTLPDFWQKAVLKYRSQDGLYGGHVHPGELDITLKPNEEYVRLWDNVGLWLKRPSFSAFGPYHTCGPVDEHDTPNFRYFEPYRKTGFQHTKYAYRTYGNGWLEWKPDASKGEVAAAAVETKGVTWSEKTGLFVPKSISGHVAVPVKSPYAVVKIELDVRYDIPEGGGVRASVGAVERRRGKVRVRYGKPEWTRDEAGTGVAKVEIDRTESSRPLYEYRLKLASTGGAKFNLIRIKTLFQLNPMALPTLYPGENKITVSAKAPQKLADHALLVTYEWSDGDGWKKPHTNTQTITALPRAYTLTANVARDKMPRMKRLVMKLAPR
jgi:hypothetical protein